MTFQDAAPRCFPLLPVVLLYSVCTSTCHPPRCGVQTCCSVSAPLAFPAQHVRVLISHRNVWELKRGLSPEVRLCRSADCKYMRVHAAF